MIQEELLKDLKLNRTRVERDLQLSQRLALGYSTLAAHREGLKAREAFGISASYFRRAAADALLLGVYEDTAQFRPTLTAGAYGLFRAATNAYENAGLPYSGFVCVFVPEVSASEQFVKEWLEKASSLEEEAFPQLVYLLMYASVMFRDWQEIFQPLIDMRQRLELYRLEPIGVLGTPIGNYLDLIDTFTFRPRADEIETAIYPFLSQYDVSIRQAQKNEYHWQRLAIPFHPVEPDVFAVMLFANRVLRSIEHNRSILGPIKSFSMGPQAKSLLEGILSDYARDNDYDAGALANEISPALIHSISEAAEPLTSTDEYILFEDAVTYWIEVESKFELDRPARQEIRNYLDSVIKGVLKDVAARYSNVTVVTMAFATEQLLNYLVYQENRTNLLPYMIPLEVMSAIIYTRMLKELGKRL